MLKGIAGLALGLVAVTGSLGAFEGYTEVNTPVGEEYTAIVCEVQSNESYEVYELDELYLPCVNVMNSEDVIHLDKVVSEVNEMEVGNLLEIVFEHDDVYSIKQVEDYKLIVK